MSLPLEPTSTLDRIRRNLVGLKMARALEVLDQTVRRIETAGNFAGECWESAQAESHLGNQTPAGRAARRSSRAAWRAGARRRKALTKPVARALNLDDHRMVEQAVQERGRHGGIAEHLAPLGKAPVRGQDQGALFVAGVHQLEEQIRRARPADSRSRRR